MQLHQVQQLVLMLLVRHLLQQIHLTVQVAQVVAVQLQRTKVKLHMSGLVTYLVKFGLLVSTKKYQLWLVQLVVLTMRKQWTSVLTLT
jgi:hypothetical protein